MFLAKWSTSLTFVPVHNAERQLIYTRESEVTDINDIAMFSCVCYLMFLVDEAILYKRLLDGRVPVRYSKVWENTVQVGISFQPFRIQELVSNSQINCKIQT